MEKVEEQKDIQKNELREHNAHGERRKDENNAVGIRQNEQQDRFHNNSGVRSEDRMFNNAGNIDENRNTCATRISDGVNVQEKDNEKLRLIIIKLEQENKNLKRDFEFERLKSENAILRAENRVKDLEMEGKIWVEEKQKMAGELKDLSDELRDLRIAKVKCDEEIRELKNHLMKEKERSKELESENQKVTIFKAELEMVQQECLILKNNQKRLKYENEMLKNEKDKFGKLYYGENVPKEKEQKEETDRNEGISKQEVVSTYYSPEQKLGIDQLIRVSHFYVNVEETQPGYADWYMALCNKIDRYHCFGNVMVIKRSLFGSHEGLFYLHIGNFVANMDEWERNNLRFVKVLHPYDSNKSRFMRHLNPNQWVIEKNSPCFEKDSPAIIYILKNNQVK